MHNFLQREITWTFPAKTQTALGNCLKTSVTQRLCSRVMKGIIASEFKRPSHKILITVRLSSLYSPYRRTCSNVKLHRDHMSGEEETKRTREEA